MTIRIPAHIVQTMGLHPHDLIDVSIEFNIVGVIAESEKFTEFCKKRMSPTQLNQLHAVYKETGGLDKHGGFKSWLVKELNLQSMGLRAWTDKSTVEELFPSGFVPIPGDDRNK
jgi:antitoxin component of MazEF toxin-antitoxin module